MPIERDDLVTHTKPNRNPYIGSRKTKGDENEGMN